METMKIEIWWGDKLSCIAHDCTDVSEVGSPVLKPGQLITAKLRMDITVTHCQNGSD